MQDIPEATQLIAGHLAAGPDPSFIGPQPLRQVPLAQLARRVFGNLTQVELFGPVVGLIKILSHPFETRGEAHGCPTGGFVSRAPKELGVHEAFH